MAANVYLKEFALTTGAWTPLADAQLVMDATILLPATNAQGVYLRWNGETGALWPAGVSFPLGGVDLALIEAKAQFNGDRVLVAANTR